MKQLRINNQIRLPELSVIDEDGTQLGVMKTVDALARAKEQGLDLVEVNPNTQPPLAKIMDYGKYMYRKAKQEKQGLKPHKEQTKVIKIGFKTGEHDLTYRAQQADKFLKEGHTVKLDIFLRGRERAMIDMSKGRLPAFLGYIKHPYVIQSDLKKLPTGWTMTIKKGKETPHHENK